MLILFLAAGATGAAWTIPPAILKARYGTNEIITTLMMSFIGVDLASLLIKGPFQDPAVSIPQTRVIGLYLGERQVGFERAFTDGMVAYLADVYVLSEHRGRGLGVELVRAMVDEGGLRDLRWLLHTRDAHALYAKFGFGPPGERVMERPPPD